MSLKPSERVSAKLGNDPPFPDQIKTLEKCALGGRQAPGKIHSDPELL